MSLLGFSSMEFFRQEYWSGLPFPSPGDLPNPGTKSRFPASQVDSLPPGMPLYQTVFPQIHSLPPGQVYDYGIAQNLIQNFKEFRFKANEMQYSGNENASLRGNVTQFFLLQSGLPFFHYDFLLEYILEHDSLVPKKQNTHTHKINVLEYMLILHTSHTESLGQLRIL